MTTEPIGSPFEEVGRGPSGSEIELVDELREHHAAAMLRAALREKGYTNDGLARWVKEQRAKIKSEFH